MISQSRKGQEPLLEACLLLVGMSTQIQSCYKLLGVNEGSSLSGGKQHGSGEQRVVSPVQEKNHFPAGPSRAEEEAVYWDWSTAKGQAPSWG